MFLYKILRKLYQKTFIYFSFTLKKLYKGDNLFLFLLVVCSGLYFEKYKWCFTTNLCYFCWIGIWFRNRTGFVFTPWWNFAAKNQEFCLFTNSIIKKYDHISKSEGLSIFKEKKMNYLDTVRLPSITSVSIISTKKSFMVIIQNMLIL